VYNNGILAMNPQMIRVAEKAGFVCEGRQRETRQWQGQWLDRVLL
jgi:RimJ/RimL family protein N-acetyltransferase